jgi:RND family efflux transporter MFP subunit
LFVFIAVVTAASIFVARPWETEGLRNVRKSAKASEPRNSAGTAKTESSGSPVVSSVPTIVPPKPEEQGVVLKVTGYIINRERIELSPRTMNEVRWIGVRKGDRVSKGQVIVRLDDAEQTARLEEAKAQIASAGVAVERAELAYKRVQQLRSKDNETKEREDEARLAVDAAKAQLRQLDAARQLAEVALDWTVIRSPIDGIVLAKLADPGELVSPQSFGGTGGPSTALVALADPNDLQVEVDVNQREVSRVRLDQQCVIVPEAYPDKRYDGHVAEIAPEASRQKGTLQVKVQITKPDQYLTPELVAKVSFLDRNRSEDAAQ